MKLSGKFLFTFGSPFFPLKLTVMELYCPQTLKFLYTFGSCSLFLIGFHGNSFQFILFSYFCCFWWTWCNILTRIEATKCQGQSTNECLISGCWKALSVYTYWMKQSNVIETIEKSFLKVRIKTPKTLTFVGNGASCIDI